MCMPKWIWATDKRECCSLVIIYEPDMRFPTMWYVRPAKPQIRLRINGISLATMARL